MFLPMAIGLIWKSQPTSLTNNDVAVVDLNSYTLSPNLTAGNYPTGIAVTGTTTFAFTVIVSGGWNMVSAPGLHPVDQLVETWWSGKDPAAGVFKYTGGYVQVFSTTPSEGYWMKNVGAQVYNYSGIQVVPHSDVPLVTGWNLFGLYEVTVPTATLQTSPPGIITGSIFEYSGGYNPATDIVSWLWILCKKYRGWSDCKLKCSSIR